MTKHADFFAALAAPFKPREVKTLKKGKTISYVTARTVRLEAWDGLAN